MPPTKIALLGGPSFFLLWFVGASIVWSAVGGETPAEQSNFAEVVLPNQAAAFGGGTLLMFAAAALLWFAAGLRERTRPGQSVGAITTLGIASIAMLLILQAGLVIEAAVIADEAPDLAWTIYKLSNAVGYESFMTSLLGALTLGGALVAIPKSTMRPWLWWLTAVFALALTVGGTLEGFGVVPDGRFAIFFGLWAFIAGIALFANPTKEDEARS